MRRRGYSIIEVIVALALVGVVMSLAVPTYRAFENRGADTRSKALLQAVEVQLDKYASSTPYRNFHVSNPDPDEDEGQLNTMLEIGGVDFAAGTTASTSDGRRPTVSVYVPDDAAVDGTFVARTAVAVLRSESGECWAIKVSTVEATRWARFTGTGADPCAAALVNSGAITGTADKPAVVG